VSVGNRIPNVACTQISQPELVTEESATILLRNTRILGSYLGLKACNPYLDLSRYSPVAAGTEWHDSITVRREPLPRKSLGLQARGSAALTYPGAGVLVHGEAAVGRLQSGQQHCRVARGHAEGDAHQQTGGGHCQLHRGGTLSRGTFCTSSELDSLPASKLESLPSSEYESLLVLNWRACLVLNTRAC
jgi:hypothetical protein